MARPLRAPRAVVVAALAGAALVTLPGPESARASCAGPYLELEGRSAMPPVVVPGRDVVVKGRAFANGCQDEPDSVNAGFGCSSPDPETVRPAENIRLRIEQGGRRWLLGVEDAGSAEDDELGQVTWDVEIPRRLRPGRATLWAGDAQPLPVRVR